MTNKGLNRFNVRCSASCSPRDISATVLRDISDNAACSSLLSVEDSAIPKADGNVRATLPISGWYFLSSKDGIVLTQVAQIGATESIPKSLLASVQQQIPMATPKVVRYMQKYGYPPYIIDTTAVTGMEQFIQDHKKYAVEIKNGKVDYSVKSISATSFILKV